MSMIITVSFWILFILIVIGSLLENFEIYPTLSKYEKCKIKVPFSYKGKQEYWNYYYAVCKEHRRPVNFYFYIKYLDEYGYYFVIFFLLMVLFQALFIIV